MAKRKDSKGIVLKSGEHQRKDGRYEYKYVDSDSKRRSVYATTLKELREKETEIEKSKYDNTDYLKGKCTVKELVDKYIKTKSIRPTTSESYDSIVKIINSDDFCEKKIKDVKQSDVKLWFIELKEKGKNYPVIWAVQKILRPAFKMAVDEDIILKNPASFTLSSVIENTSGHRKALTMEQLTFWISVVKNNRCFARYYNAIMFILLTGLRISEICGLTIDDFDFNKMEINISRQLLKKQNGERYIGKTKTKSGTRIFPMTKDIIEVAKKIFNERVVLEKEPEVDGVKGFVFINKSKSPCTKRNFDMRFKAINDYIKKNYPDMNMPNVTPHVLRHTFCTNMANNSIDIKTLQYLMGHSNASVTMNVYMHSNYDNVVEQMKNAPTYDF